MNLPQEVILADLTSHHDDRGVFTEVYRESWVDEQFKTIQSYKNLLQLFAVKPILI